MRRCWSRIEVAVERPHEVLTAPAQPLDAAAFERLRELRRRERMRPARVQDLHLLERAALDQRRQLAADRLDLRKLGHVCAGRVPTGARES